MFTAEFKKIIDDSDFPLDLVFNVDEAVVLEEVTIRNLHIEGRKTSAWLQGIQGPTYSDPWREHIRIRKSKTIAGVSLRNSHSNERHSKILFASHLDFKQKGLGHVTDFLRMVF